MEHFGRIRDHRPSSMPMQKIVAFALFSTRRQEEITLLRWEDMDGDRILVRDMKHPGDKKGNNVYCELPPEALGDYPIDAAHRGGDIPVFHRRDQRCIHTRLPIFGNQRSAFS